MFRSKFGCASGVVLLVALFLVGGCSSFYDTRVALQPELTDSLRDAKVEIHVLAVSASDESQYEKLKVSDYWGETGTKVLWRDIQLPRKMFTLSAANPSVLLTKDDSFWQGIHKDDFIFIFSSYPKNGQTGDGNADARRRILPANKDAVGSDAVLITVTKAGLVVKN